MCHLLYSYISLVFVECCILYVGKAKKEVSGYGEGRHIFMAQNRPDIICRPCSAGPFLLEGVRKFVPYFPPQGYGQKKTATGSSVTQTTLSGRCSMYFPQDNLPDAEFVGEYLTFLSPDLTLLSPDLAHQWYQDCMNPRTYRSIHKQYPTCKEDQMFTSSST